MMQHPTPSQTPSIGSNSYQYLYRPRPEDAALHITVRCLTKWLLAFFDSCHFSFQADRYIRCSFAERFSF
jgi:hypothetical protein